MHGPLDSTVGASARVSASRGYRVTRAQGLGLKQGLLRVQGQRPFGEADGLDFGILKGLGLGGWFGYSHPEDQQGPSPKLNTARVSSSFCLLLGLLSDLRLAQLWRFPSTACRFLCPAPLL